MKINWQDKNSHLILNPRAKLDFGGADVDKWLYTYPGHVWLATSGTTASPKLVGLSKQALLSSAEAVNNHISSDSNDVWIQVLPEFHVGGLSIFARAHLTGAKVFSGLNSKIGWDPVTFVTETQVWDGTLASLVPTQVFDLVSKKIEAPKSLRAVFVGGASLSPSIYFSARELGWPLLPTFGMTECGSQVASAELSSLSQRDFPKYKILQHLQAEVFANQLLKLKGPSLFTGYMTFAEGEFQFKDPKVNGWFTSEDHVELAGEYLKPLGRKSEFFKVSGEGVYLNVLRERWQALVYKQAYQGESEVVALADERLGHQIELVSDRSHGDVDTLVEKFNEISAPFERIKKISVVDGLKRSELGKTWI